jgi:hypothetical protein
MRLEEKLFYCHCIKMNAYRYQYGRQANKTLKDIELPDLPEWLKEYSITFVIDKLPSKLKNCIASIDIKTEGSL